MTRSGSEARLPPLPCTCTITVVSTGGLVSGCHNAACALNPSIALIDRNCSEAPGSGCMSSGRSAGGGAVSYSMLAAICAMLIEPPSVCAFDQQGYAEADEASFGDHTRAAKRKR